MPAPRLRLANGRFASVQQLIDNLEDPSPLLQRVGEYMKKSTQDRIKSTKTAPNGIPWAAWSSLTAFSRARKGNSSSGLLFDTGRLHDSIEYQVQARSVIVGAGVQYAKYLQEGTLNMPARPFVGMSKQDLKSIDDIVRDYLKKS